MTTRPPWCPHVDCGHLLQTQDQLCFGELPEPEPHGAGVNTHRMCMRGAADDGEWTVNLMINRGDGFQLHRLLKHVFGFGSSSHVS